MVTWAVRPPAHSKVAEGMGWQAERGTPWTGIAEEKEGHESENGPGRKSTTAHAKPGNPSIHTVRSLGDLRLTADGLLKFCWRGLS